MSHFKSFIPLFKKLEVKHKNWGMFPKTILPRGVCVRSLTSFYKCNVIYYCYHHYLQRSYPNDI